MRVGARAGGFQEFLRWPIPHAPVPRQIERGTPSHEKVQEFLGSHKEPRGRGSGGHGAARTRHNPAPKPTKPTDWTLR